MTEPQHRMVERGRAGEALRIECLLPTNKGKERERKWKQRYLKEEEEEGEDREKKPPLRESGEADKERDAVASMPSSYSILKAELVADKMKKKKRRNDPWSRSQVYMSAETIRLIRDICEITRHDQSLD